MQGADQGKPSRLWAAVVASALLQAAAHPPWSLWPLALVVVAPVCAVLLDPRSTIGWKRAAAAGFAFGTLATWMMVGPWSWPAASAFFPRSSLEAAGFTIAMPLLASGIALHYAVAFALVSRLAGLGALAGVVGSAAIWAATEWARTSLGYGNPWGAFAASLVQADASLSTFHAVTPVASLLGLGGPPAVALLAASCGSAIGLAWACRPSAVERGRALATGAVVVAALLGAARAGDALAPARAASLVPKAPLRVALVQSGLGGSRLWERSGAAESFDRNVELTRGFETKGADLVVWPENALPFLLDANADRRDALRALARERGAALLVGGSRTSKGSDGRTAVYNSAFLFPADGGEPLVYDKRVLLPFLEHVPGWIAPFLESPWQGAFSPGEGPGVFAVKDWKIAPLMCFEAIYPGEVAARVAGGADLLVNMSNDSWFDEGAGPEQHFALAALGAAESRRPLVRVASTGVSGLVREDGLVAWRLPVRTGAVALLDVAPPRRDSLYDHGGRAGFAILVGVVALGAALVPARKEDADG